MTLLLCSIATTTRGSGERRKEARCRRRRRSFVHHSPWPSKKLSTSTDREKHTRTYQHTVVIHSRLRTLCTKMFVKHFICLGRKVSCDIVLHKAWQPDGNGCFVKRSHDHERPGHSRGRIRECCVRSQHVGKVPVSHTGASSCRSEKPVQGGNSPNGNHCNGLMMNKHCFVCRLPTSLEKHLDSILDGRIRFVLLVGCSSWVAIHEIPQASIRNNHGALEWWKRSCVF
jgi:hypothetical protein